MVGADGVPRGAERRAALDHHGVGADTLDLRAELDQEMREILHMRLGGGVAQISGAARGDGCDQRVLGCGHAGLVEEDVGALEARGAEFQAMRRGDRGAELLEGEEMRVEAPAADHVAAGRRQRYFAAAGEQGTREQDRGADARAQFGVEIGGANVLGVDEQRVARLPFG